MREQNIYLTLIEKFEKINLNVIEILANFLNELIENYEGKTFSNFENFFNEFANNYLKQIKKQTGKFEFENEYPNVMNELKIFLKTIFEKYNFLNIENLDKRKKEFEKLLNEIRKETIKIKREKYKNINLIEEFRIIKQNQMNYILVRDKGLIYFKFDKIIELLDKIIFKSKILIKETKDKTFIIFEFGKYNIQIEYENNDKNKHEKVFQKFINSFSQNFNILIKPSLKSDKLKEKTKEFFDLLIFSLNTLLELKDSHVKKVQIQTIPETISVFIEILANKLKGNEIKEIPDFDFIKYTEGKQTIKTRREDIFLKYALKEDNESVSPPLVFYSNDYFFFLKRYFIKEIKNRLRIATLTEKTIQNDFLETGFNIVNLKTEKKFFSQYFVIRKKDFFELIEDNEIKNLIEDKIKELEENEKQNKKKK